MEKLQLQYKGAMAQVQLRGAQIASYRTPEGREVIWQADPAVWAQYAPVLFPVCGTARDGKIKIAGKTYPMPKHGFTREPEFAVFAQGEDFVDLILTQSEETKVMYPFDFAFHVCYTLVDGGFTTTFMVQNQSPVVMPFCVGGHPAFICPMEAGASFEDYQLVFPEQENGRNYLAPGGGCIDGYEELTALRDGRILPLDHTLFDERDAPLFAELKSRSVDLVHRSSGHGIHFSFPKMEVLAVWSKPGASAPYVCLEPWHGMPDTVDCTGNFEEKPFVTLLQPGRCWQGSFTATLI